MPGKPRNKVKVNSKAGMPRKKVKVLPLPEKSTSRMSWLQGHAEDSEQCQTFKKHFDHNDDYVKILQSAQRCKSYGGRNILKPKWRKKQMKKPAGDGGEGEAAIRDARDSFSRTELAGFQINEVNLHLSR